MSTSKYLQLEKELLPYRKIMSMASDSIIDQEITKYPIFVVHQHTVEIGVSLTSDDNVGPWKVQASSLEEFVSKQLIESNKVDSFRTIYKAPDKFFCVFVLSELGAKFIFIPRAEEKN